MHLRQLALTNVRNYARLGLDLGPGVSVFAGDNAQGKSNLLEAVHVLATTRSLRAGTDRELISWRALEEERPFTRLEGRVAREYGEVHVELLLQAEPRDAGGGGPNGVAKSVRVNGLPGRAAQLVGQVNVVLFSPEDVALAAGPPAGRRRYLDITNSQVNRGYLRALQRYNRVLVQRNHLLRQVRERRQAPDQLAPWNDEQVDLGCAILAQRLGMVARIAPLVDERFRQLSGTEQRLEIVYLATSRPAGAVGECASATLRAEFIARMAEVAPREIEQGVSLVGPHRDDFTLRLDGVDLNTFGSRGQQRLAVLALKLAESEFMELETGERPIVLLDDVLSELDPARRALVLERVGAGGQALVTTTDLSDLTPEFAARATLYSVEAGTVRPATAGRVNLAAAAGR